MSKPRLAVFHPEFPEDLRWVRTERKTAVRILELVEAVLRDPFFEGVGKPESLKFYLRGCWSRRVSQEHPLVYLISEERIDFLQARYPTERRQRARPAVGSLQSYRRWPREWSCRTPVWAGWADS